MIRRALLASYEINLYLYVVLATNPLLVEEANRSHPYFDNSAVLQLYNWTVEWPLMK